MTKTETERLISELKRVFDIVRFVDVAETKQVLLDDNGEFREEVRHCYETWNKETRCENCISSKAFAKKEKMTKFEFVDRDVYHVVSMYIEVDAKPYMLEMVTKITDETLFGAYGKNDFVETITGYNRKLYIDPLTETYNRRYYEEQLCGLGTVDAIAMIDVDDFKKINDTFGHGAGDTTLKKVADILLSHTRENDAVVRYGGDEFLMLFRRIPEQVFFDRLKETGRAVNEAVFEACPGMTVSVSIGGVYCKKRAGDAFPEADRLLYVAKTTKNDVQFSSCAMLQEM